MRHDEAVGRALENKKAGRALSPADRCRRDEEKSDAVRDTSQSESGRQSCQLRRSEPSEDYAQKDELDGEGCREEVLDNV